MRSLWSALLLTFALGTELSAQARSFRVSGAFESGATFSGLFTMDWAARSILASNITTQAEDGWLERTYTSTGTGVPYVDGNIPLIPRDFSLMFLSPSRKEGLVLWFGGQGASFTGGAIQPSAASCPSNAACLRAQEFNVGTFPIMRRFVAGGSATLVPEPSAALLLVPALGGLLLRQARRRASRVA